MTSTFNFNDYLIYASVKNADVASYATIADGVLGYINDVYQIALEPNPTETLTHYMSSTTDTEIVLQKAPINSITSVTYDGASVDYTFIKQTITLATGVTDINIPVVITYSVGYTNVPSALKLAVYRHIDAVYFAIQNKTDNIDKAINTTGNTIYYNQIDVPHASRNIYDFYSQRQIVLV